MTQERLSDFLKTGRLENIDFNFSRQDLKNLLGETEWVHFNGRQKQNPTIIKYDRVEFYFDKERIDSKITGIIFQFLSSPADQMKLVCDYNQWTSETKIETIVDYLNSNKINFRSSKNGDGSTIVTEFQVEIYFDENNYLQKLGKFNKR